MAGLVRKFLASASVVAGMSAVFGAPAMAVGFTAIGTDLILREQVGTGFEVTDDLTQLNSILQGDSSNPGGNVELGSSDTGGNPLAGVEADNIQGGTATFTNVTEDIYNTQDWRDTTGKAWFSDAWEQAVEKNSGASPLISAANEEMFYGIFVGQGGLDMITDPNISYINEVGDDVVVGLAGHLNLADRFRFNSFLAAALEGVQMSEIFAYDINGVTGYGWSNSATASGLVDNDGFSFSGNYEVVIEGGGGILSEDVPEPSTILGLMAIGGLAAATKRRSAK
ncbi:MAG: PEP-CTERM sorting domain-containing protein [Okeania sp. SIO2C2]|uniref:NF038130 family PEP-CTERM protein n=1 Tax=Okeania sp. SIO2C2 TaxID=2607787 RepID=UPI0013BBB5E9|nr:NF038130 family PEP-CTERM protein [Okeania sp. SIO2C2]NEP90764.1 PEP-CTERM sorting domain-containing protein [Okeania sp. SIO2C2]